MSAANATARVPMTTVPWGDDKIKRVPAATAATYQPGAMMAVNAAGNAVPCDDTSGIKFDGINSKTVRTQVFTGETTALMSQDQSKQIDVERPWRFTMPCVTTLTGDGSYPPGNSYIGTKVYAYDDNHVDLTTSNSILIGTIDQVLPGNIVLINPIYAPLIPISVSGNTIAFAGATGANTLTMPDNLADALSIAEGSNSYLTFKTTNSSETVFVKKLMDVVAGINFSGATTANVMTLTDNLADALNIKEGSNSYLKFVTTDSGELIVPGKNIVGTKGFNSTGPTGIGIGYATGAGGAVTQATDRTTGVTLNTLCGAITTNNASLAAGAEAEFTVTNSTVAAGDTVVLSIKTESTTGTTLFFVSTTAAGSFKITATNLHASTADTSVSVINFAVIKAVAA